MDLLARIAPLAAAWLLDLLIADPRWLPHPVVGMGRAIAACTRCLNRGRHRALRGAAMAVVLIAATYALTRWLLHLLAPVPVARGAAECILIFFCLAGTTLRREVRMVFRAVARTTEEGRRQVGRIVGRDTAALSASEVRTAALETLAENLSDGVVAPLFWYVLLGVPGMMAYKMVNTLDSMIGYRNNKYLRFGRAAARIDDAANYIPARLTALFIALGAALTSRRALPADACRRSLAALLRFIRRFGPAHASPNSGWPEAALAGALDARFGGPHDYFGLPVWKPFIGTNPRPLTDADARLSLRICFRAELLALAAALLLRALL